MSMSRLQRAQLPRMPPRPSTGGLYPLCLAQRPEKRRDRIFKVSLILYAKEVPAYEAILFDFDGVLVDSEPVHFGCWRQVLEPFGILLDWDTYCGQFIGISDLAMLEELAKLRRPPLDVELLWQQYPHKRALFRERMLSGQAITPAV